MTSDLATDARRNRIEVHIRRIFDRQQFVSVYVAGPTRSVWVSDNKRSRPVTIGHSAALRDTISDVLDRGAYQAPQRVLFRTWVKGKGAARELEDYLRAKLEGFSAVNKLRKSWIDAGPDFDETMFELEVRAAAEVLGFQCWNDDELYFHMAELVREDMIKAARVA